MYIQEFIIYRERGRVSNVLLPVKTHCVKLLRNTQGIKLLEVLQAQNSGIISIQGALKDLYSPQNNFSERLVDVEKCGECWHI